jgi:5-methylcytosine-specific restriction endonuclease McrA
MLRLNVLRPSASRKSGEAERVKAAQEEQREAQRREEFALIAAAKALEAERKHQAEVAWARRVLVEETVGEDARSRETIPRSVRNAAWIRDQGRCVECGSKDKLEFDHIIPVAVGGGNTERNIQLLCESCNRRKGKTLG